MELDNNKKFIKLIYTVSSALTAPCTVLLFAAFLTSFDAELGYFNSNTPLPYIFGGVLGISILFSSLPAFLLSGADSSGTSNKIHKKETTPLALVGAALVLLGTLGFYLDFGAAFSGDQTYFVGLGISALGVYYLFIAFKGSYKRTRLKFFCLFLSVALPIGLVIQINSYFGRAVNSVENLLTTLFALALLLYLLYEGKRLEQSIESGTRLASLLLLRLIAFSYAVSYSAAYIFGAVNEAGRFYQSLYILVIGIAANILLSRYMKAATAESESISENSFKNENEEADKPTNAELNDADEDMEIDEASVSELQALDGIEDIEDPEGAGDLEALD